MSPHISTSKLAKNQGSSFMFFEVEILDCLAAAIVEKCSPFDRCYEVCRPDWICNYSEPGYL